MVVLLINTNFPRDLTKNDIQSFLLYNNSSKSEWEREGKMLCYCHTLMHMEINYNHEHPMIWQIINYGKFFSLKRKHMSEPCSKVTSATVREHYFFCVTKQTFHVWWFLIFFTSTRNNNYLRSELLKRIRVKYNFFYQNQFSWIVMHADCRHGT